MTREKERILKAAREKQRVSYEETPTRLSADFSTEMVQARTEWQNKFRVLIGKNLPSRIYSTQQDDHLELKESDLHRQANTKGI